MDNKYGKYPLHVEGDTAEPGNGALAVETADMMDFEDDIVALPR